MNDFKQVVTEDENTILFYLIKMNGKRTELQLKKEIGDQCTDLMHALNLLELRGYVDRSNRRYSLNNSFEKMAKRNGVKLPYANMANIPPQSIEEVEQVLSDKSSNAYYTLRNADIHATAEKFFNYYESVGWSRNGNQIKNWFCLLDHCLKQGWIVVPQKIQQSDVNPTLILDKTNPWKIDNDNDFDGYF